MEKKFTRRELIALCIKRYVENNPSEFEMLKQLNRERRDLMPDGSRGEFVKNNGKLDEEADMRLCLSMPQNMKKAIDNILRYENENSLFGQEDKREADKEFKWFKENYKPFVIPDLTHKKRVF